MKKLFLVLSILFSCQLVTAQTKRALAVFIGTYNELNGKGWKKISSVNDSSLILPALRKQGFLGANTQVLINEQASIEGVQNAFHDLIAKTKLNDIVVVHISAHGEQIEDDNNDETDGLDESIVTYNALAPRYFTEQNVNYEQEIKHYLRDDLFGSYIDSLRKNAGPKGEVLVIMDNCHSGSGTRDVSTLTRGGEPAIRRNNSTTMKKDEGVSVDSFKDEKGYSPFVVISASQADELNQEIKIGTVGYGSLSYAVCKALGNLGKNSSYEGFYTEIRSIMNLEVPNQHPVIEGNAQNRTFWGGAFLKKPQFFHIIDAQYANEFVIDAGLTSGLTVGTTVFLYPSDTYDTTKAQLLGKGTITAIKNFQATVTPEKELKSANCWVFVKEIIFPIEKFSVEFNSLSEEQSSQYRNALTTLSNVDNSAAPGLTVKIVNGKHVLVNSKTSYVIDTIGLQPDPAKFIKLVNRFVKAESMRNYLVNETVGMYEVEFLAVNPATNSVDTAISLEKNGVIYIKEGTKIVIRFKNHNTKDVYFNILDIEPTAKVNAIMPNAKAKNGAIVMGDLFVEAGKTKDFTQFPVKIGKPYGDETFKIYVGTKAFDLQFLASEDDTKGRAINKDEAVFNVNFVITK